MPHTDMPQEACRNVPESSADAERSRYRAAERMGAEIQQYHRSQCRNAVSPKPVWEPSATALQNPSTEMVLTPVWKLSAAETAHRPVWEKIYSNITEASEDAEYSRCGTATSVEVKLPHYCEHQCRDQVQQGHGRQYGRRVQPWYRYRCRSHA